MSQSLMDLIDTLVRIESVDAIAMGGQPIMWSGSDEARSARAAVEQRIEDIKDAVMHDETIGSLLDGTE